MNVSRAMQNLDGQKHVLLFWYKNMQRKERRQGLTTISWQGTVIREVSEEKTENGDLSECGMKWTAVWLKQTHQLFGVSWN